MAEASAAAKTSILDSLEETILSDLGIAEVSNTSEEMEKSFTIHRGERIWKADLSNHFIFGISVVFEVTVLCFVCLSFGRLNWFVIKNEQSFHRYL
ncbi:hypothetical protein Avbf_15618 [Armadillidium vulgare]|nr:hypothetical protein Avbf_15618 [Armadillidium vulgare]